MTAMKFRLVEFSLFIVIFAVSSVQTLERLNKGRINFKELTRSMSPFYRNEYRTLAIVRHLLAESKQEEAMAFIQKVVDEEKTWRLALCNQFFTDDDCQPNKNDPASKGSWKGQMIGELTGNVREEIYSRLIDGM